MNKKNTSVCLNSFFLNAKWNYFQLRLKFFICFLIMTKFLLTTSTKKKKYTMNLKIFIKKNIFNFLLNNFTSQFESSSCERQEEKTNTNYLAMFNVLTHKKRVHQTLLLLYTPPTPLAMFIISISDDKQWLKFE